MAASNPISVKAPVAVAAASVESLPDTQSVVATGAQELIFAVVGHVGSGTSEIAKALKTALEATTLNGGEFDTSLIKARDIIADWAESKGLTIDRNARTLKATRTLQDYGDEMRKRKTKANVYDLSAVGRQFVSRIRSIRGKKTNIQHLSGSAEPVQPDGKRRAYILDSLRHPSEVELLRRIYQDAFILIGVVCEESVRLQRAREKFNEAGKEDVQHLMERDAKDAPEYGQHVADAFHLSDFFLDNTVDRFEKNNVPNPRWTVPDKLGRLINIVTHSIVVRPTSDETAMHHAYGAAMQSSCMSRQVGASLTDSEGNVLATGTNEVPRGSGGVYGESQRPRKNNHDPNSQNLLTVIDDRCAFRNPPERRFCSNTREQNNIIEALISEIPELKDAAGEDRTRLAQSLRRSRIGGLLEFSRAVHAEMDALLTAGRVGASTVATKLYVTTFPCHYCARHIVTAGVDEVQFIEPYPKSLALKLHDDSITMSEKEWLAPSQGGSTVLFKPFSGVAPRLYKRAFYKDRDLKDNKTGQAEIGSPKWGSPWHLSQRSYTQLEAELADFE